MIPIDFHHLTFYSLHLSYQTAPYSLPPQYIQKYPKYFTNLIPSQFPIIQILFLFPHMDSQLADDLLNSKTLKESMVSHFEHDKYSIMNLAHKRQLLCFEFAAAFLFTYGFACFNSVFEMDAQAAGALLMAIILSGSLSGANINPAITMSNFLKRESKYHGKIVPYYLIAQFFGANAALLWCYVLGHKLLGPLQMGDAGEMFRVLTNEAMGVFILVLFTLLLSNPNTSFIESQLSGYLSIAIFYHIARSFAPLAGLAINPAVTLAVAIQYAFRGDFGSLASCWVWLLGDIVGCLLAVLFYTHIYEPIIKEIREIKRKSQNFESITNQSEVA